MIGTFGTVAVVLFAVTLAVFVAGILCLAYAIYVEARHRDAPAVWMAAVGAVFPLSLLYYWWQRDRYGPRTAPLSRKEVYARAGALAAMMAILSGTTFAPPDPASMAATVPVMAVLSIPLAYWVVTRQTAQPIS